MIEKELRRYETIGTLTIKIEKGKLVEKEVNTELKLSGIGVEKKGLFSITENEKLLKECDDEGFFRKDDDSRGRIITVVYGSPYAWENGLVLDFQEYIEWGKPISIKLEKIERYHFTR